MVEWNLRDLFSSDKELEKSYKRCKKRAEKFYKRYKNAIIKLNCEGFMEALREYEAILNEMAKALTYAFLKFAKDSDNGHFWAEYSKKYNTIQEMLLFFEIEYNKISDKKQKKIIKHSNGYKFYLKSLRKEKKYQLSQKEERVLLKKSLTSSRAFGRLFDEHFSRMKFEFEDEMLSEEEILSKLYSSDRKTRKKATDSLSRELKKNIHLTSFIYNEIKTDLKIECDLRGYKSVEEPRHIDNKISQKSVDALINTTQNNFHLSKEYYEIKREILGYEKLYDYDRYAPIGKIERDVPFKEAKDMVLKAFKKFDKGFYKIAKRAFKEGWCDVFPKDKKRGGAFSHPASIDTHPYVMLNFTGKIRDVFTIAHELGHAYHQYLSTKVGYIGSDTPLTTSETASVFAEMLLFDHLKSKMDKKEMLPLYAGKLEDIFATLFRQIIFTTFEREVHSYEGELSEEKFCNLWIKENKKMFPETLILRDDYKYWWSYVSHFIHTPFYCYSYSYGQLLVMALYGLYKKSGHNEFVKKYIEFLSSGGSKSPKKLIKKFGFDIEDENFWQIGIDEISNMVNEFKSLKAEYVAKYHK